MISGCCLSRPLVLPNKVANATFRTATVAKKEGGRVEIHCFEPTLDPSFLFALKLDHPIMKKLGRSKLNSCLTRILKVVGT